MHWPTINFTDISGNNTDKFINYQLLANKFIVEVE